MRSCGHSSRKPPPHKRLERDEPGSRRRNRYGVTFRPQCRPIPQRRARRPKRAAHVRSRCLWATTKFNRMGPSVQRPGEVRVGAHWRAHRRSETLFRSLAGRAPDSRSPQRRRRSGPLRGVRGRSPRSPRSARTLLRGDLRVAYLAWLLATLAGEVDDDHAEPTVPTGWSDLTAAQGCSA